jgi:hypothetical protein
MLGNGDTAARILNLESRRRWVVPITPRPPAPGCRWSVRWLRICGALTTFPQHVFMTWCLIKQRMRHLGGVVKRRDKFVFFNSSSEWLLHTSRCAHRVCNTRYKVVCVCAPVYHSLLAGSVIDMADIADRRSVTVDREILLMCCCMQCWSSNAWNTCSGSHPASYPVVTGGSSLGGKVAAAWSWPLTSI